MRSIDTKMTRNQLQSLAAHQDQFAVSLYVPMYKSGKEQNEGLGQAHLKALLKDTGRALIDRGMDERTCQGLLQPIYEILNDRELWRNPAKGLAIFLSKNDDIRCFKLPIDFDAKFYISHHYFLMPLLSLLEKEGHFYVLALSQDYVDLFHGNLYGIQKIDIHKNTPLRLEDTVGSDYEQKMLQFRSGHANFGAGSFHGKGEGKDDQTKEILAFFRAVDKGVNQLIKKKDAPLILACVDWLYPLYKEVNNYPQLYQDYLSGDPEFRSITELHKESLQLLGPYFDSNKRNKLDQLSELVHTPRVSKQVSEIIPSAFDGKVDSLFVCRGKDLFGTYNEEKRCTIIDSEKNESNISLVNLAAVRVLLQGGMVYELDGEPASENSKVLCALMRY